MAITAFKIKSAKAAAKATGKPVVELDGKGLRMVALPSGDCSWIGFYRVRGNPKLIKATHRCDDLADARAWFAALRAAAKKGIDPRAAALSEKAAAELAQGNTLRAVSEKYLRQEERKREPLRSIGERRKTLERLVLPKLGHLPIADVRRLTIRPLLDNIAEQRGDRAADEALSCINLVLGFHEDDDDSETFRAPSLRKLRRTTPAGRMRTRTLSDDEIRAVWDAAGRMGFPYGSFVRFMLATGTRRNEAAAMVRSELHGTSWLIPAKRYKGKRTHLVPLSSLAQAILAELPRIDGDAGYVFTNGGKRAVGDFSRAKAALDKASGVVGWRFHDCRRVVRSLMSRIGIRPDIAELAIGHAVGNVLHRTYDQHPYVEERRHAFEALASELRRITDPSPAAKVVPIRVKR